MGCGEGTKLSHICGTHALGSGVDISNKAIELAKSEYPHLLFQQADANKLPFPDGQFDMVYTAFVLEHTDDPETVITEMVRVLKPGGLMIHIAPNYGASNRQSPCATYGRKAKLIKGIWKDYLILFWSSNSSFVDQTTTVRSDKFHLKLEKKLLRLPLPKTTKLIGILPSNLIPFL